MPGNRCWGYSKEDSMNDNIVESEILLVLRKDGYSLEEKAIALQPILSKCSKLEKCKKDKMRIQPILNTNLLL